jgi:hypothetical protein
MLRIKANKFSSARYLIEILPQNGLEVNKSLIENGINSGKKDQVFVGSQK